jgi:GntR family transcriptional regulator / MocR family aminotransferase
MRNLYAKLRHAFMGALQDACGDQAVVDGGNTGMHLLLWPPAGIDDVALARRAAEKGLGIAPLSIWSIEAGCTPRLMLNYTNVSVEAAGKEARHLAGTLELRSRH